MKDVSLVRYNFSVSTAVSAEILTCEQIFLAKMQQQAVVGANVYIDLFKKSVFTWEPTDLETDPPTSAGNGL